MISLGERHTSVRVKQWDTKFQQNRSCYISQEAPSKHCRRYESFVIFLFLVTYKDGRQESRMVRKKITLLLTVLISEFYIWLWVFWLKCVEENSKCKEELNKIKQHTQNEWLSCSSSGFDMDDWCFGFPYRREIIYLKIVPGSSKSKQRLMVAKQDI